MKSLDKILKALESKIAHQNTFNEKVSKSNVAWHIDHSLKVILAVTEALKKSNPSEYQWKFNLKRQFVYITGYIPRGVGRAPKAVQSFDEITQESIEQQVKKAAIALENLQQLDKNSHFPHPYFGSLNLKPTLRFLALHTYHHLKIIDDILKK